MVTGGRHVVLGAALLWSCGQLLELHEYETRDRTSSSGGQGGALSAGGSAGAGEGGAGGVVDCVLPDRLCGVALPPEGGVGCPSPCAECDNGVCTIRCESGAPCSNGVVCPEGFVCDVVCNSLGCVSTTVECPANHLCRVECNWFDACEGLHVLCKNGPCELFCQSDPMSCVTTQLMCGCNSCTVHCQVGDTAPVVECGDSCDCQDECR